MNIILASSSPTRAKQFKELGIDFTCHSPNIDETSLPGESAEQLVLRLSIEKAQAVAEMVETSLLIAGDQVCICSGEIVGKPHTVENAITQLQGSSGKTLRFYSGLAVLNTQTNERVSTVVTTDVTFRSLTLQEIEAYVHYAKPLHCAGSFNVEGLGIILFEKIISEDPTALLGLPMIALVSTLKQFQVTLPPKI